MGGPVDTSFSCTPQIVIDFSDEKNFIIDQKVNRQNDRWLCDDPKKVPVVMSSKFPASVMVLGVVSNEGDIMPPTSSRGASELMLKRILKL